MTQQSPEVSTPARKPRSLARVIFIAFAIALGATAFVVYQKQHTYHLATVQEGVLYRDGLKSPTQFATTLDRVHPRTVVSLIDDKEFIDRDKPQLGAESQLCESRGIKLDRIPVPLGGWPSSDDVREFLKIVSDKQNQPVLVHCAQGVRRTAFFVAAYQESVLGYDKSKTKAAVLSFGHHGGTIDQINKFIDGYDPQTQTVPADLGTGSE
jgi:protein tyrosine/serine phosphatase